MEKTSYPVIPPDRIDDLHNLDIADSPDLAVFMAGNQFMAMREIVAAFRKAHPDIEKIFYETLPPGLELKQILTGGAMFRDRLLNVQADVYTSVSEKAMKILEQSGHIDKGNYKPYLRNRLAIMVPKGNPGKISKVADLGKDNVRVSQPDPANEDIANHIMEMYRQAGGDELVHRIMEEKRAEGTTIMTVVHHRETPLRIAKRTVDAGPVWATEIVHAESSGLEFEAVEPGEGLDQRDNIDYYVCGLKNAPNPENAEKFIDFVRSGEVRDIYSKYGFTPHNDLEGR